MFLDQLESENMNLKSQLGQQRQHSTTKSSRNEVEDENLIKNKNTRKESDKVTMNYFEFNEHAVQL